MTTPLAEWVDAARVYDGGRVVALRGVSVRVARGESLAIVGPSGSGKSTLLHLLGGLEAPSRGRVLFEGLEPRGPREWARLRARSIGFVFQAYHLLPALTAWENVQVPMLGVVAGAARRAGRARALLERLGLGARLHHRPAALSGGERQRVAIARSLANDPDLVLADEPTGNLDSAASADILDLLVEVRAERGVALVLVTHGAAAAARAERVVRTFRAFAGAVSWVAMGMALVIVLNTLLMSVTERTREIGILAAVGWSPGRILGTVVLQGLLLTAIGAAAGVALGAFPLRVVLRHPTLGGLVEPGLRPEVVVETLLAALVVGALGGLYPAWRAARARPAASLRHG